MGPRGKGAVSLSRTGCSAGELMQGARQQSDNWHLPQLPRTEDLFWVGSAASESRQIPTSPALGCRRSTLGGGSRWMVAPGGQHRFHTHVTHTELLLHRGDVSVQPVNSKFHSLPWQPHPEFCPREGQGKPHHLATLLCPGQGAHSN